MKLTEKHHRAIGLMILGMKGIDIGAKLNIAPETVSRWRSDFDFQAELNRRLQENQQAARDRLRALTDTALEAFEDILSNSADDKARLAAATKVLELAKLSAPAIGSCNPKALQRDDEMNRALEEFNL